MKAQAMSKQPNEISVEWCDAVEEAQTLSTLGRETFSQTFGHLYKSEDLNIFLRDSHAPEKYRMVLSDPAYGVWVAREANGAAIGYAVAGPCDLPAPDMPDGSGELMRFYILEEFQGAGLGQRMLNIVLGWLEENFDHSYLSVYAENFGAQRLYERYGFEKVCKYSYMVGNHADPEYIMKRVASATREDVERDPLRARK